MLSWSALTRTPLVFVRGPSWIVDVDAERLALNRSGDHWSMVLVISAPWIVIIPRPTWVDSLEVLRVCLEWLYGVSAWISWPYLLAISLMPSNHTPTGLSTFVHWWPLIFWLTTYNLLKGGLRAVRKATLAYFGRQGRNEPHGSPQVPHCYAILPLVPHIQPRNNVLVMPMWNCIVHHNNWTAPWHVVKPHSGHVLCFEKLGQPQGILGGSTDHIGTTNT